jgi:hypothetical protein
VVFAFPLRRRLAKDIGNDGTKIKISELGPVRDFTFVSYLFPIPSHFFITPSDDQTGLAERDMGVESA